MHVRAQPYLVLREVQQLQRAAVRERGRYNNGALVRQLVLAQAEPLQAAHAAQRARQRARALRRDLVQRQAQVFQPGRQRLTRATCRPTMSDTPTSLGAVKSA